MQTWHSLDVGETYLATGTSEKGLSSQDVTSRQAQYGLNELPLKKGSFWRVLIEPFKGVFIAVLFLAAFFSLISEEYIDAVIVATIILVNAIIFYTQHWATSRVLRNLRKTNRQDVSLLRDGQETVVDATQLVPGDVLLLSEGERVPADLRITHVSNLQINESSLTGESLPITKHNMPLSGEKELYDRHNMAFQGTYVVGGSGKAVVVATAGQTQFAAIAQMATAEQEPSPVQKKIDDIITQIIKALIVVAVIVFALSLLRGIPANEAIRFVLSLSVAAAPEGLPVALTVIMVLGMRRMAKKKALVRSFKAIEDIGQVTTVATDKTGTLTKNILKVVDSWTLHKQDMSELLAKTMDVTQKASDPLDEAIKQFATTKKTDKLLFVFPFEQDMRMSGALWQDGGKKILYVKGAPEHVIANSNLTKEQKHLADSKMHEFAANGYRVLAVAKSVVSKEGKHLKDLGKLKLELVGLIACADELRPEAHDAIVQTRQAGISVRLITGDHYETAFHIAKKIGLADHERQVVVASDLPKDIDALAVAIKDKTVFARVLPEDKYKILQALKKTEITAMTGDGVNDVAALSSAHVGIAMGDGSDIAKDAGGIVLLDNNFRSIVDAIGEGRIIYENIRRMLWYLLATSLGGVLTMIGALLIGLPLPVTAIQILWINLIADTALVLPLGMEPAEDDHMKEPPRRPQDPILTRALIQRMLLIASTMAIVTLTTVWILHSRNYEEAYIQTIAFLMLVVAQWMNAFNARSEHDSLLKRLHRPNYWMFVGLAVAIFFQALVMFGPLREALGIVSVQSSYLWTGVIVMVSAVFLVAEIHKFVGRNFSRNNKADIL